MPSTILSDNGVSSGSAGLKTTAASDGSLALQTTTAGGSATTAVTIDTSQNVGVGVTPSAWLSTRKVVQNGNAALVSATSVPAFLQLSANTFTDSGGIDKYISTAAATNYAQVNGQHQWFYAASGSAGATAAFTQAMTLDASGNLGVGTTSPDQRLHLSIGSATAIYNRIQNSAGNCYLGVLSNGNTVLSADNAGNQLLLYTAAAERARIDSSGNLLVGTTSSVGGGASKLQVVSTGGTEVITVKATNSSGIRYMISFQNQSGTYVGSISQDGTNTTYATSSDYRLKNSIAPMTGALAKVALLKPCTYKWNADGSDGEGFIAHELAEVCPQAVTGEKDAVDAEGNPVYQGIDTSFLVATLTAAIQELKAEFDAYKATHP